MPAGTVADIHIKLRDQILTMCAQTFSDRLDAGNKMYSQLGCLVVSADKCDYDFKRDKER